MRLIALFVCLSFPVVSAAQSLRCEDSTQLPQGWESTHHLNALKAFRLSCTRPPKGVSAVPFDAQRLKQRCEEAQQVSDDAQAAKDFFETRFKRCELKSEEAGLLTGYFIPEYDASLTRGNGYEVPVYAPPSAEHLTLTRRVIDAGALEGNADVLAWMKDPADRFFLQIQGSGFIRLPDGSRRKLQFAAKTTQPYTPIGRILIEQGEVAKEEMSMQAIRQWMRDNPQRSQELMHHNASFVFFSLQDADSMPSGSHGVPLTPGQSLAVDTQFLPLGVPVFLDTSLHDGRRFAHLMITQDTGSAIKGALRGDIFFGTGAKAAQLAGRQQAPGRWWVLLP